MLWKHERPEFRSVREMGHTHHAHTYIHHTHSIADFYGPPTWRRYDVMCRYRSTILDVADGVIMQLVRRNCVSVVLHMTGHGRQRYSNMVISFMAVRVCGYELSGGHAGADN